MTAVAILIVLEISLPFLPESQSGGFQPESVLVDITYTLPYIQSG